MQAINVTSPMESVPMPVPTEVLNEDIRDLRDSNQRLTASVQEIGRSLNARIDDNHREFVTFRVEVVEKLGSLNSKVETIRGDIRTEVAEKLGTLNTSIEAFRGEIRTELEAFRGEIRTEVTEKLGSLNTNLETIRGDFREFQSMVISAISVAKWGVGIAIPIQVSLIGVSFWLAFHAGRLDSRVTQLESQARAAIDSPGPRPQR